MCMEDVRLGRQLGPTAGQVAIGGGATAVIAGPDVHRTRVAISNDGTHTVWVGFDGLVPSNGVGFAITATMGLYVFTVEEWGRLVQGPITVAAGAAGTTVAFMLATLEKE